MRRYRPTIGDRPAFGIQDIPGRKCTRCGFVAVWICGEKGQYALCAQCTTDWENYPMKTPKNYNKREKREFWEACFKTFLTRYS